MPRTIALGDLHGCTRAFAKILNRIELAPGDCLVALGDYLDRGPDVRGGLDMLMDLAARVRLVPLLGNHDQMLLAIAGGKEHILRDWLAQGGDATLASFGVRHPRDVPARYLDFLRGCRRYYETETHLFIHANYLADRPLDGQSFYTLSWESLRTRTPGPHVSGKTVIAGHTAQKDGQVLDLGYLKCIDTYVYGTGCLTALDVDSGKIWQAKEWG